MKLGIVEYEDMEVNGEVKVNFLFHFFNFVVAVGKFSQTVKMVAHYFCSNFRLVDVNNVVMFSLLVISLP